MEPIVQPGAGILFMKIGVHAQEPLESIIARKNREIEDAGFAMWGYGGNTCHPRTMVQPFAIEFAERGRPIVLCMQEMNSRHMAEQLRAEQFSADGFTWEKMPSAINVIGSRYALKITNLRAERHSLPLAQTRVAVGRSVGKLGARYIVGQVDKACLQVTDAPEVGNADESKPIQIDLVADVVAPYAVFVR